MPTSLNPRLPVPLIPPGKPLTGRKVLLIILAFFGVVIGVNMLLVKFAMQTFSGLEVKNAYQAGLAWNKQLQAAHTQDGLRWKVDAKLDRSADGRMQVLVTQQDATGKATGNLDVVVQFDHPADGKRDRTLTLNETAPGTYGTSVAITPGQWDFVIDINRNGEHIFRSKSRVNIPEAGK